MSIKTNFQKDINSYPKISVLIPDGGNYDTLKVLRCLGQVPNVTSHVISQQRWPITRLSRYCKKFYYYPEQKNSDFLDSVRRLVIEQKIDVVLPVTMKATEALSRNKKALSDIVKIPPIPKNKIFKIAQDKWAFHCFAESHKFPVPPTILVADGQKIVADQAKLNSIEYPALLKPTTEMGGHGIVKVDSTSEFFCLADNKNVFKDGNKYILQSYISGIDFCLGLICENGRILAYTLQRNLIQSEDYFSYQKVMDFINNESIIKLGTQLASTMAWDGIAFIDFRLDERDKTIKLIEVNPRLGRALLGSLSAGVNFPFIMCLAALGIKYPVAQRENTRYAHPSAYVHMLKYHLLGKQNPLKLGWHESGWRFLINDPLPDVVEAIKHLNKIDIHIWKKKKN